MRNLLIILFLIIIAIGWKAGSLGYSLYEQKQQVNTMGESLAKQLTAITDVDHINIFNGKESYLVVEGKSAQNVPLIAWFQDNKLVSFVYQSDVVERKVIEEKIKKNIAFTGPLQVTPGLENKLPLWEAKFTDQEGKLNYYIYNMKTGAYIRSYKLESAQG